jgi:hypothetical protein
VDRRRFDSGLITTAQLVSWPWPAPIRDLISRCSASSSDTLVITSLAGTFEPLQDQQPAVSVRVSAVHDRSVTPVRHNAVRHAFVALRRSSERAHPAACCRLQRTAVAFCNRSCVVRVGRVHSSYAPARASSSIAARTRGLCVMHLATCGAELPCMGECPTAFETTLWAVTDARVSLRAYQAGSERPSHLLLLSRPLSASSRYPFKSTKWKIRASMWLVCVRVRVARAEEPHFTLTRVHGAGGPPSGPGLDGVPSFFFYSSKWRSTTAKRACGQRRGSCSCRNT